jgi:UDP-glucose 4-epimerase
VKALITGAAGFIGSHLADHFLERGDEVLALDAVSWNDQNYLWPHRDNKHLHYFCDSILNDGLLRYLVRESDVVYHLAAAVGLENVIGQVLKVIDVNVKGTENVLRLAAEHQKRVLFGSTSEILGKSSAIPFAEGDDRVLGPTTVDRWVYSDTKALGEYLCLGYHRAGLPVSIVRFFNVYGPRLDREGSGRVITRFLKQAINEEPITVIGDGNQTRCFTYITDVIRGVVAAGERPEAVGEIINLGDDDETSINELVNLICRTVNKHPPVQFVALDAVYGKGYEDIPRRVPNVERAKRLLQFEATVPLETGVRKTFEWLAGYLSEVEE